MNLAIDIGGTYMRARLYSNNKEIDLKKKETHNTTLISYIEEILKTHTDIKTIGISFAGQVKDGFIVDSPNIEVDKRDIKKYFEAKHDVKLYIQNDLTCAVMAEAKNLKCKNISALYIGTGLGLGVMDGGKIIKGSSNFACEIGHIPYKKAPFKCGCKRDNCLELFSCGQALIKWAEYLNLKCEPTLQALQNSKQKEAKKLLGEFEKALFYAIGTTITLFNPEILVLGGGIVEANPRLIDKIVSNIEPYTLKPSLKECKIVKSQLRDAPLIGASLLKDIA